MSQFGAKNTPWGRPVAQQLNPQLFTGGLGLAAAAAQQFAAVPQAAVQLGPAGLGVGNLGGGVLPAVNAAAFSSAPQTLGVNAVARAQPQMALQQQAQQPSKNQRAFVGVVTKLQENYGFVDDDVFFQTSVVRGAMPRVGERVMVEANYNPNMPFKWNAFRIQLLPNQEQPPAVQVLQQPPPQQQGRGREDRWGPAPPTSMAMQAGPGLDFRTASRERSPPIRRERRERTPPPPRRPSPPVHRRSPPPRRRSPSPRRHASVLSSTSIGGHKRERSPRRSSPRERDSGGGGSRSPPRRRARVVPRYNVQVPKISMDVREVSVLELKKRYPNMYVPSDFFHSKFNWQDSLPAHRAFSMDHSSSYHIMHRDVDPLVPNIGPLDPPDADHRYCAKVMLMAIPSLAEIYLKSLGIKEDGSVDEDAEPINPNRLISFLVGLRGKSEVLAIGGPWSPSLDGADPEGDPRVLVRTAVRTTLALTGIDLSKCTQWYKFLELRYRRIEKERSSSSADCLIEKEPRVNTVVVFLPDVWNLLPTKLEFEGLQTLLKNQLETKIAALDQPETEKPQPAPPIATTTEGQPDKNDQDKLQEQEQQDADESMASVEDGGEEGSGTTEGGGPTHYSKLDFKSMKVVELRSELSARGLDTKGVKSVLVTRLQQAAKEEKEAEDKEKTDVNTAKTDKTEEVVDDEITILNGETGTGEKTKNEDTNKPAEESESEESKKKREADEKEKQRQKEKQEKEKKEKKASLERHYALPSNAAPGILVFPHKSAKGGKFDCKVMSLGSLLDYRQDDNKEHSFEVALFAESFNEMLTRDCAFRVYKALSAVPNKESEKKDKKEQKTEEKGEDVAGEKEQKNSEEVAEQPEGGDVEKMDTDTGDMKQETEADQAVKEKEKEKEKESKPKEDSKKEKPKEKDKDKKNSKSQEKEDNKKNVVLIKDPGLFFAFAFFDQSHCGYLFTRDAEEILYTMGLQLSRAQVQRLLKRTVTRDTLNYRKLIDTVVSKDTKEVKVEPGLLDLTSAEPELAAGNTRLSKWKSKGDVSNLSSGSAPDVSESPSVMFQGSIVDVLQILDQLKRLEREQQNMEQRNGALEKELKNSKDRISTLEKKKRRLEDDADRYKKRYQDAEKCLKTSQDDTVQLKTALQECKKMGEKIAHVVDKALPAVREEKERSKSRSLIVGDSPAKADSAKITPVKKEDQKPKQEQGTEGESGAGDVKPDDAQSTLEKKLDQALENAVKNEENAAAAEEMTVQDEVIEAEAEDEKPEADMVVN